MDHGQGRRAGLVFRDQIAIDTMQIAPLVADSYREFAHGFYRFISRPFHRPVAPTPDAGTQATTSRINETIDGSVFERWRVDGRLDYIVHHLGLALGGRPAASFARRLMLPVSNDTLLRVVRRRARVPTEPLNVIGIDDWAWRRNHRYGTIVCDLERLRPVTLLPDREPATAAAWLERHREITVVARDRGGGYGQAVSRTLPHVTQIADRWHLMENASRAFLDAVRKTMREISGSRPILRTRSRCCARPPVIGNVATLPIPA